MRISRIVMRAKHKATLTRHWTMRRLRGQRSGKRVKIYLLAIVKPVCDAPYKIQKTAMAIFDAVVAFLEPCMEILLPPSLVMAPARELFWC